ncbi:CHC2 zinc finger domain-containing protein [Clostridium tunisiense]|uniref:CHC2 zinc finger domain-containing protein n=1 Tax=Clostridium tunisiense TaxID=219748 RepID=UPI000302FBF5|nr:CHC2 zinc finger domain-containing protein [Clostridium tunisiense]
MENRIFFERIHGTEKINFRVLGGYPKNLNGTYEEMEETLRTFNEKGNDIHFVVNQGGTKGCEISKVTAVYIDLDCGKDKNGKYFELSKVRELKIAMMEKIKKFMYKPSFVVDTRNGYHVYWLVQEGASLKDFLITQLRLINYFESDKAVKTLEHTMRVPNLYWLKDKQNKYICSIIEENNIKYDISDILGVLPECKEESCISENALRFSKSTTKAVIHNGDNIEVIKNKDIIGLRNILFSDESERKVSTIFKNIEKVVEKEKESFILLNIVDIKSSNIIVKSREELYNLIKQIDLIEFLGYGGVNCNCIFHEDHKPSASIYTNEENGHWLYKCHSTNCNFDNGSIIDVVMSLQGCNFSEAIKFICEVYGIDFIKNEDCKNDCAKELQNNIDYLQSGLMEKEYPNLFKRIKNYLPILIKFNEIAIEYSYTGDSMFFTSIRNIANQLGRNHHRRIGDRINLFAFLGLIYKLNDSDIPEEMLKKSKELAEGYKNHISYYEIPQYSKEILDYAEYYATQFKECNMTMTGWSWELIYRTFGKGRADRVFPQLKGQRISKKASKFSTQLANIIMSLLEHKAYVTEKELLSFMEGAKSSNFINLKKTLQEILETYDLIKIRLNKQLKQKLSITSNGYGYIILKEEIFSKLQDREVENIIEFQNKQNNTKANNEEIGNDFQLVS